MKKVLLIFVLAAVMRIPFLPFSVFDPSPLTITGTFAMDGYYELSQNLIHGVGYSRAVSPPAPDDVRTPLYPLFIVGVVSLFGSYKMLFILQLLIGCLTAVLAYLIAKEILGASLGALLVGIAMAVEPLTSYLSGVILTETVFTFLFLSLFWVLLYYLRTKTPSMLVAFSFLLGIATLVKPTTQYLPLLFVAVFWLVAEKKFTKRFFVESTVMLCIFLAVLSPWLYRNYRVFNNAALTVQSTSNLFAYLVPSTIALSEHISFAQAQPQWYAQTGTKNIEDVTLRNASKYRSLALAEISKHPLGLVESFGITLYAFFTNDAYRNIVERYSSIADPVALAFIIVGRLFWIILSMLALWGTYRYMRVRGVTPTFVLLTGSILYFAATTAVIGLAVNGRFRIPVDALLFILAAYALPLLVHEEKYNADR